VVKIAPRTVTFTKADATVGQVGEEIKKQTGFAIEVPKELAGKKIDAKFDKMPFWEAVEKLAEQSGCRIALAGQGREVRLVKMSDKVSTALSAVDGPFRVAVRQVIGKRDFETGDVGYEVHLDMMWEARLPIYYADTEPLVTTVASRSKVQSAVTGYLHPLTVRLTDVPRAHQKIDKLDLTVTGIGAEKMLPFIFDLPFGEKAVAVSKEQDGVKVSLRPVKRTEKRVEVIFDLEYPDSQPKLESFQQFTSENRLRLVSPDGRTKLETNDYSTEESGRRVRANYIFTNPELPANLTGWKAEYETPSPLMELTMRFSLKNILLP